MISQISLKAGRILLPLILHMLAAVPAGALLSFFHAAPTSVLTAVAADTLCLPVFLYLYRRRKPVFDVQNVSDRPGNFSFFIPAFLSGAAASVLSNWIINTAGLTDRFPSVILRELSEFPPALQIIGLSFIVPAAEELLYRGLVRNEIRVFAGKRVSAIVSAVLFAIGHGNVLQAVFAFPMGLWLAFCQDFGGIGAAISCHIGYNLASVAAAFIIS